MWNKILSALLILYAIKNIVFLSLMPSLLGSQIDKEYAREIDTYAITKFANQAEDAIGETGYCIVKSDDSDCITVYLGSIFEETSGSSCLDYRYMDLKFEVFDENKFSSRSKIDQGWLYGHFDLDSFDTVTTIRKNNVRITVTEKTKISKSENAQRYLEAVMNYISVQ